MSNKFKVGQVVIVRRDSGADDKNVYRIDSYTDLGNVEYYMDYLDTDPRHQKKEHYGLRFPAYFENELVAVTEQQLREDDLDCEQLEALADPYCNKCHGRGCVKYTDWVPYGSTNVPMDTFEACDCAMIRLDEICELNFEMA